MQDKIIPPMADNGTPSDSSRKAAPGQNMKHAEECNLKSVDVKGKGNETETDKRTRILFKFSEVKINKPLIPLKIAIFCWFGGSAAFGPFIGLYLKHLGLTLNQLSAIYVITPVIQLFGPTVSGIVADKIGRSKPVLQANLLLSLAAANCILFMPAVKNTCISQPVSCKTQTFDNVSMTEYCNIHQNNSHLINCNFDCSINVSQGLISDICFENYVSSCYVRSQNDINITEYALDNETAVLCTKENYLKNSHTDVSWCVRNVVSDCNSICNTSEDVDCKKNTGTNQLFISSLILLIVFQTFFSNSYRVFDVTTMSMVKTYNSDFGHQRVWAITGAMILSPLSGYIINVVSPEGRPPRYDVPFYIFDVMVLITIVTVWKLDVMIEPPAKNMLKKTYILIKDVDILVFMLTIFVLGSAWGFTKLYSAWYLEDLGAPSTLIGVAISVGSLTGLPFLFTSNWFVQKFGSSNLLLFSLFGYVVWGIGYSFLTNPWWALAYQVLEIPTYHLLWVTAVTHSHSIAPPGLRATLVTTVGGIHYGVGKGFGGLIGGFVMSTYGGRTAYRVIAGTCAGAAILYGLYIYYRKKSQKEETKEKNEEV